MTTHGKWEIQILTELQKEKSAAFSQEDSATDLWKMPVTFEVSLKALKTIGSVLLLE